MSCFCGDPACPSCGSAQGTLDPEEEKARALAEEAETAGWSAGQLHEESVRRGGGCGAPRSEPCPRGGWILTSFDSWVACSVHGPGKRHPEDGPPPGRGQCRTRGCRNSFYDDSGLCYPCGAK
jgi:hypothetical protein